MKNIIAYLFFYCLIAGCSSTKRQLHKSNQKIIKSGFYDHQFTGFLMINSQNNDTLFNLNSQKYFTPASNTKIFTLFTALELLPERIPALRYSVAQDTLFVKGTGDPTLLHSYFKQNKTLDFLKQYDHVVLSNTNFEDEKFGPGWAWEDYQYYFQPEKSPLPIYGNVVTLYNSDKSYVTPKLFKDSIFNLDRQINRELEKNQFYFSTTRKDTLEVPFKTKTNLTALLLGDALGRKVGISKTIPIGQKKVHYSVRTDTVLKRMMHESDNFLAEQLLLVASSTLSDTLNSSKVRRFILDNALSDVKQQPRWVDGSGLSRYNLFTPESIVHVLHKMYFNTNKERLFDLFPTGGQGTLKDWYPGNPTPYLFAKTGSVGNNHNISGYLITKSGKTLIFSFMNNHFRRPSLEIKQQMQIIFEEIRDTY